MADRKMFATRIDPDVLKALKHLSVDTELSISDLTEEVHKRVIPIYQIRLISVKTDLAVNKYDFAYIDQEDKFTILSEIFATQKSTVITEVSEDITNEINIIIGIVIIVVIIIILIIITTLVMRRTNRFEEEEIKGAKEMVATMLMWAKRHRDEALK